MSNNTNEEVRVNILLSESEREDLKMLAKKKLGKTNMSAYVRAHIIDEKSKLDNE